MTYNFIFNTINKIKIRLNNHTSSLTIKYWLYADVPQLKRGQHGKN